MKGKWKPRRIPNPDFYEDTNPFQMTSIVCYCDCVCVHVRACVHACVCMCVCACVYLFV